MNIGMLWYDNDHQAEINTKIQRAATYYHTKYGVDPNVVFVNPCMLNPDPETNRQKQTTNSNITIKTSTSVLPNHFWIGINGTS